MPILTAEQKLNKLRRRRDFLADRIRQQLVDPRYDKAEHSALCWAIRFVEDHYEPEDPQMERQPLSPGRTESRDSQKCLRGEPAKAPKAPPLIPTVPHGMAR